MEKGFFLYKNVQQILALRREQFNDLITVIFFVTGNTIYQIIQIAILYGRIILPLLWRLTPLNQWWKNLESSRGLKCLVPFPALILKALISNFECEKQSLLQLSM